MRFFVQKFWEAAHEGPGVCRRETLEGKAPERNCVPLPYFCLRKATLWAMKKYKTEIMLSL